MASQVYSGTGNFTYTNNTGQNVRVVINYMSNPTSMSWKGSGANASTAIGGGANVTNVLAIGRNLAFSAGVYSASSTGVALAMNSNNMVMVNQPANNDVGSELTNYAMPTEIMLASGDVFSAFCGSYNIVVIPEAG